ncbi:MAG: TIR domain-containing protein [Actinomycetota bacterium]
MGEQIFISYRRQEAGNARSISTELISEFGDETVFQDVDSIDVGERFPERVREAIERSRVVLVVIGPEWSVERLHSEGDWVRIEIATALELGKPLVPIRFERAVLPSAEELPTDMAALVEIQAAEIEYSSWARDLPPILDAVRPHLEPRPEPGPPRPRSADPHDPEPGTRSRTVALASVGALIVVFAAGLALVLGSSGSEPVALSTAAILSSERPATTAPDATTMSDSAITSDVAADPTSSEIGSPTTAAPDDPSPTPGEVIEIVLSATTVEVTAPAELEPDGVVAFPEPEAGELRVAFETTQNDDYVVWVRVQIPPEVEQPVDANSMFVVAGDNVSRSDEFVWDFWENAGFPDPGAWAWDRISRRGFDGSPSDHADDPLVVPARVGSLNSFTLGGREAGVLLDRVIVTNDREWRPVGCDVSQVCSRRAEPEG